MTIERLAVALRLLTWTGAILVVALPLAIWLGPPSDPASRPGAALAVLLESKQAQRPIVLGLLLTPFLCVAWGLAQLSSFCGLLARGDQFTRAASLALKRFGWAIIAAAVLLPVTRLAAMAQVATLAHWSDILREILRLSPILGSALGLIIGLIVVVLALVLEQATAISDENASFL